jgi:hypothetical protein
MKKILIAILVAVATLVLVERLAAHHSFSAEFDRLKPVKLEGKVVKMDWVNPHSWLYLDVPNKETGKIERWAVEGGSPGVMFRNGFKKDSFPEGIKVTVSGSQAKDGSLRANASNIEFPDGRKLDAGSSAGSDKGK